MAKPRHISEDEVYFLGSHRPWIRQAGGMGGLTASSLMLSKDLCTENRPLLKMWAENGVSRFHWGLSASRSYKSFVDVQSLSCAWLFVTPRTAAPILYYLPEIAQIHVHWVGDAVAPSHPLLHPFTLGNWQFNVGSAPRVWQILWTTMVLKGGPNTPRAPSPWRNLLPGPLTGRWLNLPRMSLERRSLVLRFSREATAAQVPFHCYATAQTSRVELGPQSRACTET